MQSRKVLSSPSGGDRSPQSMPREAASLRLVSSGEPGWVGY